MSYGRQLYAATFLTLTLSLSAWAGQMETPYTAPPPPPTSSQEVQTLAGAEETPITDATTTTESVIAFELSLLQAVLSVL